MWQPVRLELNNLISHKETIYEFNLGVSELINGLNLDDDGQESNGSGKSVIPEGCLFALTGSFFRKVKQAEAIMDGEDGADATFLLKNSQTGDELEIFRSIHHKKASKLKILKNGKKVKFSSIGSGNGKILDFLGISREDLMSYFIVHKDNYEPFFTSSDTKKKETIGRFSGASAVDHVDSVIGQEQKEIESEISKVDRKISSLEGKISAYEEQLENVDSEEEQQEKIDKYIDAIEKKIKAAEAKISELEDKIKKSKENIPKKESEVEEINDQIDELREKRDSTSVEEYENKIIKANEKEESYSKKKRKIKKAIREYENFLGELEKNLAGVVQCPECDHEFSVADKDLDVKTVREQVPEVKTVIDKKKESKKKVIKAIDAIDGNKENWQKAINKARLLKNNINKKIDTLQNNRRKLNNAIKSLRNMIDVDEQYIVDYKDNIKKYYDDIEAALEKETEDKKAPIIKSMSEAEEDKVEALAEKEELEDEIAKLQQWSHRFKKFKTHLSNRSISSIEAFTNFYLKKMKCNLSVGIEGYKILSSGDIRDNISIHMRRNGIDAGSFGKFSNGEKVRVLIANILCLQKLINLNSGSGGLDLLFLDEIIESVDEKGVTEILKSLTAIEQTVRVITHASTSRTFIDDVTVVKENGYSRIEQQVETEAKELVEA